MNVDNRTIDRDYFNNLPDCEVEAKPEQEPISTAVRDGLSTWVTLLIVSIACISMGVLLVIFGGVQ